MELQLWSSRFLMCDWKCMCVYVCLVPASLFCFDSTKTVHASIYLYFKNLILLWSFMLTFSGPGSAQIQIVSGYVLGVQVCGWHPALLLRCADKPPACRETVNISTADNRQSPNDGSKESFPPGDLQQTVGITRHCWPFLKLRTMYSDWASICRFSMSLFNMLDASVSSWQRCEADSFHLLWQLSSLLNQTVREKKDTGETKVLELEAKRGSAQVWRGLVVTVVCMYVSLQTHGCFRKVL